MYSTDLSHSPLENVTLRKLQAESRMPRNHSFGLIYKFLLKQQQKPKLGLSWILTGQKPLSVNIPSNRNAEVQLHWRHTNEVQHSAEVPTCGAVGCENRSSSGVEFFRIPTGSHPFQQNWLPRTKKPEDWNNATADLKKLVFAVLTSFQARYHLSALSVGLRWKAEDALETYVTYAAYSYFVVGIPRNP